MKHRCRFAEVSLPIGFTINVETNLSKFPELEDLR